MQKNGKWWGRKNSGEEMAKDGERQKERIACLVIRDSLSKTPLPTLRFNDSSHVRNKLWRRWSPFHLLSLASLLPQPSWSAVGFRRGRKKKKEDWAKEKSKKLKHFDLWSIIYFQSNAFTWLHLRNTGSLWSLFQQVTNSQSPPPHSYSPNMVIFGLSYGHVLWKPY